MSDGLHMYALYSSLTLTSSNLIFLNAGLPNLNDNPDDGWTSFDNFFKSMLSTFQLITLDYWERLYELVSAFEL